MSKLAGFLDIIITNNDLEGIKDFFYSSYRIQSYINYAFEQSSFHNKETILEYIISKYKNKIHDANINYVLRYNCLKGSGGNISYIIVNNYSDRMIDEITNMTFRDAFYYHRIDIVEIILKRLFDKLEKESIYFALDYSKVDIFENIVKFIQTFWNSKKFKYKNTLFLS